MLWAIQRVCMTSSNSNGWSSTRATTYSIARQTRQAPLPKRRHKRPASNGSRADGRQSLDLKRNATGKKKSGWLVAATHAATLLFRPVHGPSTLDPFAQSTSATCAHMLRCTASQMTFQAAKARGFSAAYSAAASVVAAASVGALADVST